jgi:hypothetical protein
MGARLRPAGDAELADDVPLVRLDGLRVLVVDDHDADARSDVGRRQAGGLYFVARRARSVKVPPGERPVARGRVERSTCLAPILLLKKRARGVGWKIRCWTSSDELVGV